MNHRILALALLAITSCTSPQSKPGRQATSAPGGTAETSREALVNAFRELQQRLADPSGASFAQAFAFPVADSVFYPYIDDKRFNQRYTAEGRQFSEKLFIEYFPHIAESMQLGEFRELFRQIQPERIRQQDSIYQTRSRNTEPCLEYYLVNRRGNEIEFSYGSDHNDAYQASVDDEGEVCEWATIWFFRFDGKQLRFVRMFQAG